GPVRARPARAHRGRGPGDSKPTRRPDTGHRPAPAASLSRAMTGPRSLRVVIAEDATLFREGLARLLADRGHRVVAAVADAAALLAAVAEHDPDVAVADIRMPPH